MIQSASNITTQQEKKGRRIFLYFFFIMSNMSAVVFCMIFISSNGGGRKGNPREMHVNSVINQSVHLIGQKKKQKKTVGYKVKKILFFYGYKQKKKLKRERYIRREKRKCI